MAFLTASRGLMCNIAGGILAAFIAGLFEGELARVAALAFFIPVVLAVAESVSIQSLSLTLQLLRPTAQSGDAGREKWRTEMATGTNCWALAAGMAVGLTCWLWLGQPKVVLALLRHRRAEQCARRQWAWRCPFC